MWAPEHAGLCRRWAIRKWICQQFQPMLWALSFILQNGTGFGQIIVLSLILELILRPISWITLFTKTTTAKRKQQDRESSMVLIQKEQLRIQDQLQLPTELHQSTPCACHPSTQTGSSLPHSAHKSTHRCHWLLVVEQSFPKSHKAIPQCTVGSYTLSNLSSKSSGIFISLLAKASCDKRLHRYKHFRNTGQ